MDSGYTIKSWGVCTDKVPRVDAADGALRLVHLCVCKACSSFPSKTKLPKLYIYIYVYLIFFLPDIITLALGVLLTPLPLGIFFLRFLIDPAMEI